MKGRRDEVLNALSGARGEGMRIAELRKRLSQPPAADELNRGLDALAREGLVRRSASARWTLSDSGRRSVAQTKAVLRENLAALPETNVPAAPELAAHGARVYDPSQERVIQAPTNAALVVESGPGFGKTDVLCARVARMLDQGEVPSKILVLSFTRTAVHELRERIRGLAKSGRYALGVHVATLDSFAARLVLAAGGAVSNFAATVAAAAALLQSQNESALEHVDSLRHVFVDEAQDLVGVRAEFVTVLLRTLPVECGLTVFADPAQAIYDWSEDGGPAAGDARGFVDRLRDAKLRFDSFSLEQLHRTRDPDLRKMLLSARSLVLDAGQLDRGRKLNQHLRQRAVGASPVSLVEAGKHLQSLGRDAMVIFRWRSSALQVADSLADIGQPARLRLGGLQRVVEPWVARSLMRAWQAEPGQRLTRRRFEEAWTSLEDVHWVEGWDSDDAWTSLRNLNGPVGTADVVDVSRVRSSLACGRIPEELLRDIGVSGPVVGTIHGAKGREAARVHLALWAEDDVEEGEERVLYVGLSRAREQLVVERFRQSRWSHAPGGRSYRKEKSGRLRVEIGRADDLHPTFSAPRMDALQIQSRLWAFDGNPVKTRVRAHGKVHWIRADGEDVVLGALSHSCLNGVGEAWSAAELQGQPGSMDWACWRDVTSVAIETSDPGLKYVASPFRELGIWLCPVLAGFGLVYPRTSR